MTKSADQTMPLPDDIDEATLQATWQQILPPDEDPMVTCRAPETFVLPSNVVRTVPAGPTVPAMPAGRTGQAGRTGPAGRTGHAGASARTVRALSRAPSIHMEDPEKILESMRQSGGTPHGGARPAGASAPRADSFAETLAPGSSDSSFAQTLAPGTDPNAVTVVPGAGGSDEDSSFARTLAPDEPASDATHTKFLEDSSFARTLGPEDSPDEEDSSLAATLAPLQSGTGDDDWAAATLAPGESGPPPGGSGGVGRPLDSRGDTSAAKRQTIVSGTRQGSVEDRDRPMSDYELGKELARGGMGIVYRAWQPSVGRRVAIKKLIDSRANSRERDDFLSEARVTAFLEHPNIVPIHSLEEDDAGELALAMKLVGGKTWLRLLHPNEPGVEPLDLDTNLRILDCVCNAMAFAHSKGIAHLDLKPENIMVGEFGEVLVMDWGLAHEVSDQPTVVGKRVAHRSTVSSPFGTPAYMAPELALGDGANLNAHTDIFLLGAILHEILTGKPPYRGSKIMEILKLAVLCKKPELPDTVPEDLRLICEKAMAREPEDRYDTVQSFQADLELFKTHRESLVLSEHARELLTACQAEIADREALVALVDERRDALYARFTECIAGFRQALTLWPENVKAQKGEQEALRAFAETTLSLGDLGQARSLAMGLATEHPRRASLLDEIDVARQERERAARAARLTRWGLVVAVATALVGGTIFTIFLAKARNRAEASELLAKENERLARESEANVLRMSDLKRLELLATRAEGLWPATPDLLPAMREWLAEGEAVAGRADQHRRTLLALRSRALPYSEEARAADEAKHPLTAQIEELRKQRAETSDPTEQEELDAKVTGLQAKILADRSWTFTAPEDQWFHDVLSRLVAQIETFAEPTPYGGTLADVRARVEFASTIAERSISGSVARDLWREVTEDVGMAPQLGLLPIGKDPASGLWEFAHLQSGAAPERDSDGKLLITEESAIVLVLIPGGVTWIGAERDGDIHVDPQAEGDESPLHQVKLDSFFLAKHEMTQGQWLRLTGKNPSRYGPEWNMAGHQHDLRHPVEFINWFDASNTLAHADLRIPTEVQWEHAARAGTTTPWFTGAERDTLIGFANLADRSAAASEAPWPSIQDWPDLNDGYALHSPAGAYRANPWGLYDVHGNVGEWCQDQAGGYGLPTRPGDGLRLVDNPAASISRGYGYDKTAAQARCAYRHASAPDQPDPGCGVRPAREVRE